MVYVQNYPKITIGVVNGFAVGGGLELLLCLDLVYAGKTAKFGQTELNVGIIPGGGGTQRLPFAAGIRKAKEMIYTGKIIDSSEALVAGIINGVYDDSSVLTEALKIAEKINEKNFLSLVLAKRSIDSTLKDMSVHHYNLASSFQEMPSSLLYRRCCLVSVYRIRILLRGARTYLSTLN